MKITKRQLRQIIKEEYNRILQESSHRDQPWLGPNREEQAIADILSSQNADEIRDLLRRWQAYTPGKRSIIEVISETELPDGDVEFLLGLNAGICNGMTRKPGVEIMYANKSQTGLYCTYKIIAFEEIEL